MSNDNLDSAPYVSLATFKRSGEAVCTPVWSAPADGAYYVFSAGNAGKVKRLRNSPKAQLAVCDVRGKLLGEWYEAHGEVLASEEEIAVALRALRAKYRVQMWMADFFSKLTGKYNKRAYIRVRRV